MTPAEYDGTGMKITGPHVRSAKWVQAIYGAAKSGPEKLSQEKLAALAKLSRGGLTKLMNGTQRPRMDTIEKLRKVAPPELRNLFQAEDQGGSSEASDHGSTVPAETKDTEGYMTLTDEGKFVAQAMDEIDKGQRRKAMLAVLNLLEEKFGSPTAPSVDRRPGRARHTS